MLKIIANVLLFLFIAFNAYAGGGAVSMMVASGVATTSSCDSCTGGLLLSWHCENLNVATGTPCGCSAWTDQDFTANSSAAINNDHTAQDGSNHGDYPTALDYHSLDLSSDAIKTVGTVILYLKIQTFANNAGFFSAYIDANNSITGIITGTDDATGREIRILHEGNNTTRIATTNSDLALDTWYKITMKWSDAAVGGIYLSVQVDAGVAGTQATAIVPLVGSFGANSLRIGESQNAASNLQVDNVKIYDSWL